MLGCHCAVVRKVRKYESTVQYYTYCGGAILARKYEQGGAGFCPLSNAPLSVVRVWVGLVCVLTGVYFC